VSRSAAAAYLALAAGLRAVLLGGDAACPAEVDPFRESLPPSCRLHRWYATAEGGLLGVHTVHADDPAPVGALPAGRPAFDRDLVVVDEQGRPRTYTAGSMRSPPRAGRTCSPGPGSMRRRLELLASQARPLGVPPNTCGDTLVSCQPRDLVIR